MGTRFVAPGKTVFLKKSRKGPVRDRYGDGPVFATDTRIIGSKKDEEKTKWAVGSRRLIWSSYLILVPYLIRSWTLKLPDIRWSDSRSFSEQSMPRCLVDSWGGHWTLHLYALLVYGWFTCAVVREIPFHNSFLDEGMVARVILSMQIGLVTPQIVNFKTPVSS